MVASGSFSLRENNFDLVSSCCFLGSVLKEGLIRQLVEISAGVNLEDLNGLYRKFFMSNKILDDELSQIRELLVDIASKGTKTFILWFQGAESSEMSHRESLLKSLYGAGLVDLEWQFTHHNAYIKTRITEKGTKLIQLIGVMPKSPVT
jgi:hypothetical protein